MKNDIILLFSLSRTFAINVKAVFNVSQIVVKSMIENKIAGSIVNISSQVYEENP